MTFQNSIQNIYWLTGIIEGEGTFCCKPTPKIVVPQKNFWLPYKLQEMFNGSIHLKEKYIFTWEVYGERAIGIMFTIFSLLSDKRRAQIKKVIELWKEKPGAWKYKKTCVRGHEWNKENTRIRKINGNRQCKVCEKERKEENIKS